MELFKLTTPKDDAWQVVESLGELDLVHFLNMNEGKDLTKLIYQERIKLCEEAERLILSLLSACRAHNIKIDRPESVEAYARTMQDIESVKRKGHELLFDAIEAEVRDIERFVESQRQTIDEIKRGVARLQDFYEVLQFTNAMIHSLEGAQPARAGGDAENPSDEITIDSTLQFLAGAVRHEEIDRLQKMIFRITKGKALVHFNPYQQAGEEKAAYLIVFSAAVGYRERVERVCDSFVGERFAIPDAGELEAELLKIQAKITKAQQLYDTSVSQLQQYLFEINSLTNDHEISTLEVYKWFVAKEKAIYYALNQLSLSHQTFLGFVWVPTENVEIIRKKLEHFPTTDFSKWNTPEGAGPVPPTSFKTNDMLEFHQISVNMYKFATYGEINPAVFQVVTFPFLFAVMYGDYGHGMIFFAIGAAMCLFEEKLKRNPAMKGLLVTRYFWLMMGFFAIYQGLIYNEFFAIPHNWFGTCYDINSYDASDPAKDKIVYNNYPEEKDCVYKFGMDPSWALSSNYLTYTNNIKEKLAVIIAYFHLNFGIVLNALNTIYKRDWKKMTFDIITGFFIFLGLIGYMIVLIYVKWWYPVNPYTYEYDPTATEVLSLSTSPSIINLLIGDVMGMTGFSQPNDANLLYFPNQQNYSNILVYAMFISLPTMLCAIPCIHVCCGGKKQHDVQDEFLMEKRLDSDEDKNHLIRKELEIEAQTSLEQDYHEIEKLLKQHYRKEGGHDSAGEVFIHQVIETIEFVLGCISNTASYLRLWALSLAHGQLGEVFIQIFYEQGQSMFPVKDMSPTTATVYFFLCGFGYMFAVFCVLLLMDCLEVFLHTMRLHWVEFMGKFFEGAGIQYKPFSFKEVFEQEKSRKTEDY